MEVKRLSHEELLALYDQQQAEIARLTAENKAKEREPNTLSLKVKAKGEKYERPDGSIAEGKGVVSCNGLGRFPVSLYAPQWRRLATAIREHKFKVDGKFVSLEQFLEANKDKISEARD